MFENDPVEPAVPGGDEGQSSDEAALAGQNPAGEAVESGAAAGSKPEGEIVVGNNRYPNLDAFVKAHQELQKGFTQKTQQFSRELAVYKGISKWFADLRRDPDRYERFLSMLKNGVPMAEAAQAAKSAPAASPQQAEDPYRERFEAMEREMAMDKATREAERFLAKHPELSEEEARQVIERTIELQDEGRERSLEEVYRTEFFDMAAAKFYSKGEQNAKSAQEKSAKGSSLGSVPPAGQGKPKSPKYSELKGTNAKDDWIRQKLAAKGFKFDTE